jgi:iron complex outermembrane recepter protein
MTMLKHSTLTRALLMTTSVLGMLGGGAAAQQPATAPGGGAPQQSSSAPAAESGLENIVVYAQRKSVGEAVQTVPVAEMAISGQAMEAQHIQDLTQIGRLMPNVNLLPAGTFPLFPNFNIRGIGNESTTRSVDPAVNILQDGMVLGYQAGALVGTFDTESIEVLRGPQGVLFGRNASGGAVVMRTPLPKDYYSGDFDLTIGNANTVILKGDVSGPLVGDTILGKIAIMSNNNTGLWTNTTGGTFVPTALNPCGCSPQHPTGGIGQVHELVVKPTLLFNIEDDVQLKLFTQYQQANDGGGILAATNLPGAPPLPLQTAFGYTPSNQAYTTNLGTEGSVHLQEEHAVAELDLNDVLGGTLTTTAAIRHVLYGSTEDADGSPFNLIIFPNNREQNLQYSFESRYNGSIGDQISYLVGVFLYDSQDSVREQRALNGLLAHQSPTQTVDQLTAWGQNDKSAAAYANVDYRPFEGLTLSAGLRYGYETKHFTDIPVGFCAGTPFVGCPSTSVSSSKQWYDLAPRFVASYQIDRDHLVYASYSKGFRAGNYNGRATTIESAIAPTNPESVSSYEVGSKNEFFDRRLRLNLTGFYEDYSNIQETVLVTSSTEFGVQFLQNAASAYVYGAEVEASWLVTPELRLDASGGALQTHYNSFIGLSPTIDVSKLQFFYVPNYTADIAATYTVEVPQTDGKVELRGSYRYQSSEYTDAFNTPYFKQPDYGIIDASVTYTQGDWRISAFGRNLQNTVFSTIITNSAFYFQGSGQPRTYGVEFSYHFGKTPETTEEGAGYVPPPVVAPVPSEPKSYLVFFDFNRSDLTPQAGSIVDQAAKNAETTKVTQLTVTGHTDTVGSDAYNMRLSRRRAESVAAQLEKDGISSNEIEIIAKGKRDLLVPTADGVKEPQNRRVQIVYSDGAAS